MNKSTKAYTFVEIIIVITIISILSVIWVISYLSYLSSSRDWVRKSELSDIYSFMESYKINKTLPLPNNKVDIYSSWILIWYQWDLSNDILKVIWYKGSWKDPLDDIYYTYFLNFSHRFPGVLWYLENNPRWNLSFVNQAYAIDYTNRYPIIFWKRLWIILDPTNQAIQNNTTILSSWSIDVSNLDSTYQVFFDNNTNIDNEEITLEVLYGTYITWIIWNTCEEYYDESSWYDLRPWYYLMWTSTGVYQKYCSMSFSWQITRLATCEWSFPANAYATNWYSYVQEFNWTERLPSNLSWSQTNPLWCDFNCNDWYVWNWSLNMCLLKINWICWPSDWQNLISQPSYWLCNSWTPKNVYWFWPTTWSCIWENDGYNVECSTTTYCAESGIWADCIVKPD